MKNSFSFTGTRGIQVPEVGQVFANFAANTAKYAEDLKQAEENKALSDLLTSIKTGETTGATAGNADLVAKQQAEYDRIKAENAKLQTAFDAKIKPQVAAYDKAVADEQSKLANIGAFTPSISLNDILNTSQIKDVPVTNAVTSTTGQTSQPAIAEPNGLSNLQGKKILTPINPVPSNAKDTGKGYSVVKGGDGINKYFDNTTGEEIWEPGSWMGGMLNTVDYNSAHKLRELKKLDKKSAEMVGDKIAQEQAIGKNPSLLDKALYVTETAMDGTTSTPRLTQLERPQGTDWKETSLDQFKKQALKDVGLIDPEGNKILPPLKELPKVDKLIKANKGTWTPYTREQVSGELSKAILGNKALSGTTKLAALKQVDDIVTGLTGKSKSDTATFDQLFKSMKYQNEETQADTAAVELAKKAGVELPLQFNEKTGKMERTLIGSAALDWVKDTKEYKDYTATDGKSTKHYGAGPKTLLAYESGFGSIDDDDRTSIEATASQYDISDAELADIITTINTKQDLLPRVSGNVRKDVEAYIKSNYKPKK